MILHLPGEPAEAGSPGNSVSATPKAWLTSKRFSKTLYLKSDYDVQVGLFRGFIQPAIEFFRAMIFFPGRRDYFN
jgi:hypothetical protein